jgi:hypothetical protein
MSSSSYGSMFPSTAYWLSLIGGALIALAGVAGVLEGIFLQSFLDNLLPGEAISALVIGEGVVGIVLGAVIVYAALRLKSTPASTRTWGIVIIVLAFFSIFGGDGFFLGLILALLGGILAATWRPPVMPQPVYGPSGYGLPLYQPTPTSSWGPPAAPPLRPGTSQRFCSHCGSPNLATAQFCAKCGAPMS